MSLATIDLRVNPTHILTLRRALFMSIALLAIGSVALPLRDPLLLNAATISVPGNYSTIQAAINAASAGDTIIVGDGTYTENLAIDKALTIQSANGADNTTIQALVAGTPAVSISNAVDVTIDGFTITGSSMGIAVTGTSTGTTLTNLVLTGGATGVYLYGSLSDIAIEDSTISGATTCGIHKEQYSRLDGVTIARVAVSPTGGSGISLPDYNDSPYQLTDVVLDEVTVSGGSTGIYVSHSYVGSGNASITNCEVINTAGHAIQLVNGRGTLVVTSNEVSGVTGGGSYGLYLQGADTDPRQAITLSGNTIDDCPNGLYVQQLSVAGGQLTPTEVALVDVRGTAVHLHTVSSVAVSGYTLETTGLATGIYLHESNHIVLDGLAITGATSHAIYLTGTCDDIAMQSLTLSGGPQGVYFYGSLSDIAIGDSTISGTTSWGIRKDQYSRLDGVTIARVTVSPAGGSGISLPDYYSDSPYQLTDVVLDTVTVSGGSTGIYVSQSYEGSGNASITNCEVNNTAGHGIQLTSGRGTLSLTDNAISGVSEGNSYGLYVQCADTDPMLAITLSGNTIDDCPNGLYLQQLSVAGGQLTPTEVALADVRGTAVQLHTVSSVTVSGYTLETTGLATGIYLHESKHIVLDDLAITGATSHAIYLTGTCDDIAMQYLTLSGGPQGVYFYGSLSDIVIEDSTISGTTSCGIRKEQYSRLDGVTIARVTVSPTGGSGISLHDYSDSTYQLTDVVLDEVTVSGGAGGIYVAQSYEGSGNASITNCEVTNTASHGIQLVNGRGTLVVTSNEVSGATGVGSYGLYLQGADTDPRQAITLSGNTIDDCPNGLYLQQLTVAGGQLTPTEVGFTDTHGTVLYLGQLTDVTVSGYEFDYSGMTCGITLDGCNDMVVDGIPIDGATSCGVSVRGTSDGVTLTDLDITCAGGTGISLNGTISNVIIEDSSIGGTPSTGVYLYGTLATVLIEDIGISGSTSKGIDKPYNSSLTDITLQRVEITPTSGYGVYLQDWAVGGSYVVTNVVLDYVTVTGGSTGINVFQEDVSSGNVSITNCTVSNTSGNGIQLDGARGIVAVSNNSVTGAGGYGLHLTGATTLPAVTLSANVLDDNANGLYLQRFDLDTLGDELTPTAVEFTSTRGTALYLHTLSGVTVKGYDLDYTGLTTGIHMESCNDMVVSGISIDGVTSCGVSVGGTSDGVTLTDLDITCAGGTGISLNGTISNVIIEDSSIGGTPSTGVYLYGTLATVLIEDIGISGSTSKGIDKPYNSSLTDITLQRVEITPTSGYGVYLQDWAVGGSYVVTNVVLDYVTVTGGSTGINVFQEDVSSGNVSITNCTVSNTSGNGIQLDGARGIVAVSNNSVSGAGGYGLHLTGATADIAPTLSANVLDNNANGLYLRRFDLDTLDDELTPTAVEFTSTRGTALYLHTLSGVTVKGYDLDYTGLTTGIHMESCNDMVVDGIPIDGVTSCGVSVGGTSDGVTLTDLDITCAGGTGISLSGAISNVTIEDSTIGGTPTTGIYLSGVLAYLTIEDVGISGSTSKGIDKPYNSSLTDITLLRVAVAPSSGYGVYLQDWAVGSSYVVTNVVLDYVTVTGGSTGINVFQEDVSNGNVSITNCTVSNTSGNGIQLDGARGIVAVSNNSVSGAGGYGLHLTGATTVPAVTLAENTLEDCPNGLYLQSFSGGEVSGNTIRNNAGNGIRLVSCSSNTVYNNYLADNGTNAVDDGANTWNVTKTDGPNIIGGPWIGGNYWSDYTGADTDDDGLGDTETPHTCDSSITTGGDYLPLVLPTYEIAFVVTPSGAGTIVFDGSSYGDGDSTRVQAADYPIEAEPGDDAVFGSWEHSGLLEVEDSEDSTTNVTVSGAGTLTLSLHLTTEDVVLDLKAGWNMVSVPVVPANTSRAAVFPPADVVAVYTWDPVLKSYGVPTTIEPELGYWVAVITDKTIKVTGTPKTTWPSSLITGWNMVGSVYGTAVSVNDADAFTVAPPGSVLTNAIYWWDPEGKSYVAKTSITQGCGYWAATTQNCNLTMTAPQPPEPI